MDLKIVKRNEYGLLEEVDYIFNESGRVNWRAMIQPHFLVFNLQLIEQIEKTYGKPISELKPIEVEDRFILILLAGIKDLARLRGYSTVKYNVYPASENCIAATCEIEWLPNFETENRSIIFSDGADGNISNTSGFGKNFLTTIAINRSFVRAVRNFLGINILGSDELSPKNGNQLELELNADPVNLSIHAQLERAILAKGSSFEKVKERAVKLEIEGSAEWNVIEDIPKATALLLIGKLSKVTKKKE